MSVYQLANLSDACRIYCARVLFLPFVRIMSAEKRAIQTKTQGKLSNREHSAFLSLDREKLFSQGRSRIDQSCAILRAHLITSLNN